MFLVFFVFLSLLGLGLDRRDSVVLDSNAALDRPLAQCRFLDGQRLLRNPALIGRQPGALRHRGAIGMGHIEAGGDHGDLHLVLEGLVDHHAGDDVGVRIHRLGDDAGGLVDLVQ